MLYIAKLQQRTDAGHLQLDQTRRL